MKPLAGIFALVVAAAGWYYLFYSKAASRLEGIEDQRRNRLRVNLRRAGGLLIILLAVAFYGLIQALDREWLGTVIWLGLVVLLLMGAILVLGLVDLRLTARMREERMRQGRMQQDQDRIE